MQPLLLNADPVRYTKRPRPGQTEGFTPPCPGTGCDPNQELVTRLDCPHGCRERGNLLWRRAELSLLDIRQLDPGDDVRREQYVLIDHVVDQDPPGLEDLVDGVVRVKAGFVAQVVDELHGVPAPQ
ncbi:hypothetical protein HUT19_28885 [Streptomyces sp. NA02950]|uniref:hypothetical protein n=1 Tax=Streptomyces sp. NA02950 TaxID=2742137 RepID=UPI0015915120|nr:hypothetical protein [Streptomyces sp. NA02950]QKV95251.1 hypothetical protein HUT19_28885 [Streptomyces sp. NA02950]